MCPYIDYPFIHCGQWVFALSCPLISLYLIIHLTFPYEFPSPKEVEDNPILLLVLRRKVLSLIGIYVLCFVLYWFPLTIPSNPNPKENWLLSLADKYLENECLIYSVLVLLAAGTIVFRHGTKQYTHALDRIAVCCFSISAACMQVSHRFSLLWSSLSLCMFFIISVVLEICQIETTHGKTQAPDVEESPCNMTFCALQSYEQLFDSRKVIAENLKDIIIHSKFTPFTICVSGTWGIGKTSVVNGALALIKEKYKDQYETIYINALELDTTQSLKIYVFRQIQRILKERGTYVGIGSDYQQFMAAAAGVVSESAQKFITSAWARAPYADYREEQFDLEKSLSDALGTHGRLIIVIDDVERCDSKKAMEFLFFLKEIATMDHCIAIFLTDYKLFVNAVKGLHIDAPEQFMDKFFNRHIELHGVQPEEAMAYYEQNDLFWKSLGENLRNPSEIYAHAVKGLDAKLEKVANNSASTDNSQAKEDEYRRLLSEFKEQFTNPRYLTKLYSLLCEYRDTLKEVYSTTDTTKKDCYFSIILLDELLFFAAYIETFFPDEIRAFQQGEPASFEDLVRRQPLIAALSEGFLYNSKIISGISMTEYTISRRWRFIKLFYQERERLSEIATPYTTHQAELIAMLEEGHTEFSPDTWTQCITAVIQEYSFLNIEDANRQETGMLYISKLLNIAQQRLMEGRWTQEQVLAFMKHNSSNVSCLTEQLAIMKEVWDTCNTFFYTSPAILDQLQYFSIKYVSGRLHKITQLLKYTLSLKDEDRNYKCLKEASDAAFSTGQPAERIIERYLSTIEKLSCYPNVNKTSNVFDQLDSLVKCLKDNLSNRSGEKYPDVCQSVEVAERSVTDLRYFSLIIGKFSEDAVMESTPLDILQEAETLKHEIPNSTISKYLDQAAFHARVDQLFNKIQSEQTGSLTTDQINHLQDFLTEYYIRTGSDVSKYRRILMHYK